MQATPLSGPLEQTKCAPPDFDRNLELVARTHFFVVVASHWQFAGGTCLLIVAVPAPAKLDLR